ncbi:NDP-sugar dehydratase/ epimerase [Oleispira antarctica RB-8]|uniref:NDP-sugar dehydratase/ epimerase n=1 Tax=Oleispira antarctica RB-8 TaxID=698738 RepID=R4YLL9_OLEAN|nr:NDP-sugar dehydratase/ epimerase [Oleispira antarctica RB-8]
MDNNSNKKKVLVFGACGFMGTYLIDELVKRNYSVVASDIDSPSTGYFEEKNISFVNIDITKEDDFDKLSAQSFDVVVHLAAHQPANVSEKGNDPASYVNVNILGTLNILKYCERSSVGSIIYGSSHRNTQGLWCGIDRALLEGDGREVKFDTEYTLFSITETAAQDLVEYYTVQHGLRGITFRLPPVYGYGPHTEIFKDGKPIKTGFQIFIDKAMTSEPIEVWGDSSVGRDIIYIKDVINAFILAIEHDTASGLFNITSGKKLTLMEEVSSILDVFGPEGTRSKIIEKPEIDNSIDSFYYDISKAKEVFGWEPQYTFKDMLKDFIKESSSKRFSHLLDSRQVKLNNYKQGD